VETPNGDLIDPGVASTTVGSSFVAGSNVYYYRMTLPVPVGASGARSGTWYAVLSIVPKGYDRYLYSLAENPELYQETLAHGMRYSLSVHAYSNLRMQASLSQDSFEPGATLTVRARLREYGLPVENRASVQTELVRPDDTSATLSLAEIEPGVFETQTPASLPGIYRLRVRGSGTTLRARPFAREQLLTGSTYKGGDDPFPTGKDDPTDRDERLCRFLSCLLSSKTISNELEARLLRMGVNVEGIRRCLRLYCPSLISKPTPRPIDKELLHLVSAEQPKIVTLLQRVLDQACEEIEDGEEKSET
jgi:hypothetical protein